MAQFQVLDKSLTYALMPNETGATTFPINFETSREFKISLTCSYVQTSNSHRFNYLVDITGSFDGFSANNFIPYLRIYAESSNTFYNWDLNSMILSQIAGTVELWEEGTRTSQTAVSSSNLRTTFFYNNLYFF